MNRLLSTTLLISALTVLSATAQTTTDPAAPGTTPAMPDSTTGTTPAMPDATTGTTPAMPDATTGATAPSLPEIMAPEGFVRQNVVLTAEDLIGATIYDINGDSVGDVRDLVLKTGAGTTSSNATSGTADTATSGTSAIGTADTATSGTGTSATGTADTAASGTGTSATGTADTAASGTGTSATGTMNDSPGATVSPSGAEKGEVTHAVLDIGGFLGLGQHTVAVPVSDLAVYRSDTDTRVYLPWSEEQLKAVPAYNRDDPSTYGRSLMSTP